MGRWTQVLYKKKCKTENEWTNERKKYVIAQSLQK